MYAIRSYYDQFKKMSLGIIEVLDSYENIQDVVIEKETLEYMNEFNKTARQLYENWNRITSYNVCYTKLLRALNALEQFIHLIQKMKQAESEATLDEHVDQVIKLSGLIEHFRKEKGEKGLF